MPTAVSELKQSLQNAGLMVVAWSGARPKSNNILEVRSNSRTTLLYVKESNSSPGFWGLTANRLSELRASGHEWFTVLLLGSQGKGYFLTSADVERFISSSVFKLAGDGDHKVNERDLPKGMYSKSIPAEALQATRD